MPLQGRISCLVQWISDAETSAVSGTMRSGIEDAIPICKELARVGMRILQRVDKHSCTVHVQELGYTIIYQSMS